jgi:hypothetical protein
MPRQDDKANKLVAVATAMINGEVNLIEGVRKINALRYHVENPDGEIFHPILAIEDERSLPSRTWASEVVG